MKTKIVKIKQRKPDASQDESSYTTTFLNRDGMPIICGFGHTQAGADEDALTQVLEQEAQKRNNKIWNEYCGLRKDIRDLRKVLT